jgi:4'-phosphopantetheinyl transferase EntD
VAALADRADFLAKVRAARQALQRVAPPAQPISPGSLETNTDD